MAIVVFQFDYTVAKRDPSEPVSNYSYPQPLGVFVAVDTQSRLSFSLPINPNHITNPDPSHN